MPQGPHDRAGRSTAVVVVTPVRRWWAAWLRADFAALALLKRLLRQRGPSRPVRKLSFISFGRWAVVSEVGGRRLPDPYILFQSNFNGAAAEYVEAFARGLKWRMRGLWGGAYNVPDPSRLIEFTSYIEDHWVASEHYYCAYPQASTKIILAALEVHDRFHDFARRAEAIDPGRFADELADFVATIQRHL